MKSSITRSDDNSITIQVTVPWANIEKTREEVENDMAKKVSVPGFRKGMTPLNIAKQNLSKEQINEEILRKALPKYYIEAVKEHNINPVITPRIHVDAFEEGTDMVFTADTCEEPKVDLKNYKDEVKKVTAKSKIILPGKEDQEKKPPLDEILEVLISNTNISIPKILIDQETNRLLSQMIDELKTLGLTLEQYLASRGKTGDQMRQEYEKKAERDLKVEFLLRKISDTEKITVDDKDIQQVLSTLKDEKQKTELSQNKYLLASIIRQQKTLDFLENI